MRGRRIVAEKKFRRAIVVGSAQVFLPRADFAAPGEKTVPGLFALLRRLAPRGIPALVVPFLDAAQGDQDFSRIGAAAGDCASAAGPGTSTADP